MVAPTLFVVVVRIQVIQILVEVIQIVEILIPRIERFQGDILDRQDRHPAILGAPVGSLVGSNRQVRTVTNWRQAVRRNAVVGQITRYGLGAVLYFLLAGKAPYAMTATFHNMQAVASGAFKSLRRVRTGLPAGIYDVVERAMSTRPQDRFATVREMADALAPICGVELGAPEESSAEIGLPVVADFEQNPSSHFQIKEARALAKTKPIDDSGAEVASLRRVKLL